MNSDHLLPYHLCRKMRHSSLRTLSTVVVLAGPLFAMTGCAALGPSAREARPDPPTRAPTPQTANSSGLPYHPKAQTLVVRAIQDYRDGKLEEARTSLRSAREIDPYFVLTYELEADVALDTGDTQGYGSALQAALAANPQCARLQNAVGRLFVTGGRPEEGLHAMERAVELAPNEARFSRDLAAAHLRNGHVEAAQQVLSDAIENSPVDDSLPLALARLHEVTGNSELAAYYYTVALKHDSTSLMIRRQRARCRYRVGDYKKACDDFAHCVADDVLNLSLGEYAEYGDACLRVKDYEVAQLVFDQISRCSECRLRHVELLRSLCALNRGRPDDALDITSRALTHWPEDEAFQQVLVLCNALQDNSDSGAVQQASFEAPAD